MAVKPIAQIGLEDEWIKDSELEELLEAREKLSDKRLAAVQKFKEKDGATKDRIAAYDFPPGETRRCGKWLIKKAVGEAKDVSFKKAGGVRLTITKAEAE